MRGHRQAIIPIATDRGQRDGPHGPARAETASGRLPARGPSPGASAPGAQAGDLATEPRPTTTVSSICCYCGTGCGVRVHARDGQVIGVEGDAAHPSSLGRLCSKGLALADTVRQDDARVLHASLRDARDQPRRTVPLATATDDVARRLAGIIARHGPDAVGFYLSGQLLTEDYALFNKLARGLVGTNNIDTNSRLCMSSAVSGYKLTLGADAPPACYDDLALADCVFIAGANMAFAHPVLFRRLEAAKAARPDMRVIVVDPRRTDTTALADLHLPIRPGTDVALFHGMLHILLRDARVDRDYIDAHTDGFAALAARVRAYTPAVTAALCGVPAADIETAARWFSAGGPALSLYTMGLNQSSSGTTKNAALIHLHLATGQIGKPGAGPFSLTGQPNAMGGREAGGMATLLPGHRDPTDARHRAEVAALWDVPSLPATPGLPALQLFDAVLDGRVKVLWIAATNPAQSLPDQARVRAALEAAELVIVQEAFAGTETLAYADIVLPAATWPEKDGTVTNSERRVSRVRAAIAPPGDARADWQLVRDVALALARRIAPERAAAFDYPDAAAVFAEHARTTAGRDLDYSALSHAVLDKAGPQQWPYKGQTPTSTPRLYADGRFPTPSGRARFLDIDYQPVAEAVSAEFPWQLTTGRLRDHWHTMARTSLAPALTRHVEDPAVGLHPEDMTALGLGERDLVRLRSARGELVIAAQADAGLPRGLAFLPMHWGSAFLRGDGVNALTLPTRDPVSHQPELKHAAVHIAPAALPWQVVGWVRGDVASWRRRLSGWLQSPAVDYACVVPVARGGTPGIRIHLACATPWSATRLEQLAADLDLATPQAAFDDPARGLLRRVARSGACIDGYLLAGDMRAANALDAWADGGTAPASVLAVLTGRTGPVVRSRTVCACQGVSDIAIRAGIADGLDLDGLKASLGCGTGCGSCVPELRRMLAKPVAQAA